MQFQVYRGLVLREGGRHRESLESFVPGTYNGIILLQFFSESPALSVVVLYKISLERILDGGDRVSHSVPTLEQH